MYMNVHVHVCIVHVYMYMYMYATNITQGVHTFVLSLRFGFAGTLQIEINT